MTRYMSPSESRMQTYGGLTGVNDNPYQLKYTVWLAGYWEDFGVSYAVAEGSDNRQNHTATHWGNPMNGEARLNPYYRFSFPDRNNDFVAATYTLPSTATQSVQEPTYGGWVTNDIRLLHNLGSHEHVSIDPTRLGLGTKYASILNNEYPDSNSHSNRFKFGGKGYGDNWAQTASYMLVNTSFTDIGRYYIHGADVDSTNGRSPIQQYGLPASHTLPTNEEESRKAGNFGGTNNAHGYAQDPAVETSYLISEVEGGEYGDSSNDKKRIVFTSMATTTGRFNFDAVKDTIYGLGQVFDPLMPSQAWELSTHGAKATISADIRSPSGKPFFAIQQTFPANHIIAGQVFAGAMGASFPSGTVGGQAGEWLSGDLSYASAGAPPTGTDYHEYTDLIVGDLVSVAGNGLCVVQEVDIENTRLVLYDIEGGNLIQNHDEFDPADAGYVGAGAALDNVPLRRFLWPVMNYDGHLNMLQDGDTFHMRFCPQHLDNDGLPNGDRSLHYVLKIGYDKAQINWTSHGNRFKQSGSDIHPNHYNACVEIDLKIGTGSAAKSNDGALFPTATYLPDEVNAYDVASGFTSSNPQHAEAYLDYDASGSITTPNYDHQWQMWYDLDVVFDFTNQKYDLYIDGKLIATNDMLDKPNGGTWSATDLKGWHMDAGALLTSYSAATNIHTYDGGQLWTQGEPQFLATLIDRVGVVHELTKPVCDVGSSYSPAPSFSRKECIVEEMTVDLTLDNAGAIKLVVEDDANETKLHNLLKETNGGWKVLVFNDNLDDVITMADVMSIQTQQDAKMKTKTYRLDSVDAISNLDRVMPYWEVGQSAYGPSTTYVYRRQEAQAVTENFYLGQRRLQRTSAHLGLDHQSRAVNQFSDATINSIEGYYSAKYDQRTKLYSAHPIQMYDGEEGYGYYVSMDSSEWKTSPTVLDWRDNVWNMWSVRRIIGFSDGSNHTWPNQASGDEGRGIICHCIEHGLKVGDTFTLSMHTRQNQANPFTYDGNLGKDGLTVEVVKLIDKNHFVYIYDATDTQFGPFEDEVGCFWSIIRRPPTYGGLGPAGRYGFYGANDKLLIDSGRHFTQLYLGGSSEEAVYRFEVDGRLMSYFHTSASATDKAGNAFDLDYDDRINWFERDFSKHFFLSPWSGESYSEMRAVCVGGTAGEQFADYQTYIGCIQGETGGWAKYRRMGFKPAAAVYLGAQITALNYLQGGTTWVEAGTTFYELAADTDNILTVGPVYWMVSGGASNDTALQYLNKGTDSERSQNLSLSSLHQQELWDGNYDPQRPLTPSTTNAKSDNRLVMMLRGNEIDQVEPMMPTTDSPFSTHDGTYTELSGNGPATRNSGTNDAMSLGYMASGSHWHMHDNSPRIPIRFIINSSGTMGTASARYTVDVDTTHANIDPDYATKKLLIPRHGGEFVHYEVGGTQIEFHYEEFNPSTNQFLNCRIHHTYQQGFTSADFGINDSTPVEYIRLNCHPMVVHSSAVFIPPEARASRARNRPCHALWMQDIRKSLWFKMVFGIIDNYALHHDGPPRGTPAIKGGTQSPHITRQDAVLYQTQSTDFFTLASDFSAGATTMTITPSCRIPMTTPDGTDHRYISMYGSNIEDIGTDPTISIPSKASLGATNGKKKNGGLIFEMITPSGEIDIGVADEAQMTSCADGTDPLFEHWEIVAIEQDELKGFSDKLLAHGIGSGQHTPGPIWVTCAYEPTTAWNTTTGTWTSSAPIQDEDYYHSGDPAAVSGLQGFANINVGDTIFLGNMQGRKSFPPTDDANAKWNPNNPNGEQRCPISYRWYVVLEKSGGNKLCVFPAEWAFEDENYSFTKRGTTTVVEPLKHQFAHYSASSHKLPRGSGSNPYQGNLPTGANPFPTQSGPAISKLYCGDITLSNCKFTKNNHLAGARGRFRDVKDNFQHIYLLWADMRNDGSADADGGERKDKFGLIYPTTENYSCHLIYALSQQDIVEFKLGDDVDLWQMDSLDPYTEAIWSDNYTNTIDGDYNFANFMHNWEDKAGSFLIIDTSKFFNLNTYANNGRIGQFSGGSKNLDELVIQSAGFPELMDNYWWWVMPHPMTAKYRYPYDPSWRFVCRYTTKLAERAESGQKPIMVIDSSPYYSGSYWDTLSPEGIYEHRTNADPDSPLVSGTWKAYGSFVTDYDESNAPNAKRMYLRVGARNLGANDTFSQSAANTYFYENQMSFAVENDHNLYEGFSQHNLPWMMVIDGFVETASSNTYYEHDKIRLCWQNGNSKTWLGGSRLALQYDISEVPLSKNISTTQQSTTTDIASYGSSIDARGKTIARIAKMSQQASGNPTSGSTITKYHYQVERGRFVYRPSYSSFLTLNRDNLRVSESSFRAMGTADFVRVFFNNGQSFVDYPEPSLGDDAQSSKWKMIDASHIASSGEARALAIQQYEAGKRSRFNIKSQIIRESGQKDLLEGGRHGYIASSCLRHLPSTSVNARSNTLHHHSLTAGCLFGGRQNALDGNLDGLLYLNLAGKYGAAEQEDTYGDAWDEIFVGAQGDIEFLESGRGYHGSGTSDPYSVGTLSTDDYEVRAQQSYGWYGIGSVDKAIQVVHIPKDTPKVSQTTGEKLRVIISHNSDVAFEGKYRIHLIDMPFQSGAQCRHIDFGNFDYVDNMTITNIETNGIIEVPLPTTYGSGSIVLSFNKEYCDSLLRFRSHNATSSLSGKGNRVDIWFAGGTYSTSYSASTHSFNANSTKNNGSAFPLGLADWDESTGHDSQGRNGYNWLHRGQALWHCPTIEIVNDWAWRPGRTVQYTDDHLGVDEQMHIDGVNIVYSGQDHETVSISIKRDDSQASGSARVFQLPNLGDSYRSRPEPPAPPVQPDEPDGGSGGGSSGGRPWYPNTPPQLSPPRASPPAGGFDGGSPLFPTTPSLGLTISPPSGLGGRGNAMGTNMGAVDTHDGQTHDNNSTGTFGIKMETTPGSPSQNNDGIGSYFVGDRISINQLTKGAYDSIKGKGDLAGEAGIEGKSGLLGVNRNRSTGISTTTGTEYSITSQSAVAGNPQLTAGGFVLPGRVDYADSVNQVDQDYHEVLLTTTMPQGSAGSNINVKARIDAPAEIASGSTATYTIFTTITNVETGYTVSTEKTFNGSDSPQDIVLVDTQPISNAQDSNTLEIRIGRVPAGGVYHSQEYQEGSDNAPFQSVEFKNIRIYSDKKNLGASFTNTITDRLRAKDNTLGLYTGTNNAFQFGGVVESNTTAGEADRTNEGSGQSDSRKGPFSLSNDEDNFS